MAESSAADSHALLSSQRPPLYNENVQEADSSTFLDFPDGEPNSQSGQQDLDFGGYGGIAGSISLQEREEIARLSERREAVKDWLGEYDNSNWFSPPTHPYWDGNFDLDPEQDYSEEHDPGTTNGSGLASVLRSSPVQTKSRADLTSEDLYKTYTFTSARSLSPNISHDSALNNEGMESKQRAIGPMELPNGIAKKNPIQINSRADLTSEDLHKTYSFTSARSLSPNVSSDSVPSSEEMPSTEYGAVGKRDEQREYINIKAMPNIAVPPNFPDGWCDRGFHVDFAPNESEPLQQLRFLGQGLNGPVYETECKGITLAWKRKFRRGGIGPRERKEIDIMKKLSHTHIVQLAGTYTLGKFFGLLVWPVATCDLATLLEDLNSVKKCLLQGSRVTELDSDAEQRFATLGLATNDLNALHHAISRRLLRSFGCLTDAVAYFHGEGIKHKDLKPANILLSRGDGLWVTDFESSTDFSQLTTSVTEEGERGTAKYFAPEVAARQPSSRPADIFSLGCIFLEMFWMSGDERNTLEGLRTLRPKEDAMLICSYHANLDQSDLWFSIMLPPSYELLECNLSSEIAQMLAVQPYVRPTAFTLKQFLAETGLWDTLYGTCCVPRRLEDGPHVPGPGVLT